MGVLISVSVSLLISFNFFKLFAADRKSKTDLPKVELSKTESSKTELAVEKQEPRRSPNMPKKFQNGPVGISNPAYIDAKPMVTQKPIPSQKSYPAPPPPSSKPLLPKKKFMKGEGRIKTFLL